MLILVHLIRGKARNFYGGYLQATYDFGQGTNIGYSYGQNKQVMTGQDSGEYFQGYTDTNCCACSRSC